MRVQHARIQQMRTVSVHFVMNATVKMERNGSDVRAAAGKRSIIHQYNSYGEQ